MQKSDIEIFELLKLRIVERMRLIYPGKNPDIGEWKGQDIVDFQEELLNKVNARISEKWFYSHFKNQSASLPRIDTLNLLSKFAGYGNWDDFRFKQLPVGSIPKDSAKNANIYFVMIPALMLLILTIFYFAFKIVTTRDYKFVFVDEHTQKTIINDIINVSVLKEGGSPTDYLCKSDGTLTLSTDKSIVSFVVKSPNYQTDTITIVLDKVNRKEIVALKPDKFSLMLDYFMTVNVKDWKKERNSLDVSISDEALICEVFDSPITRMDTIKKWEFIQRLARITGIHRDIRIIEKRSDGEKITYILFQEVDKMPGK